MGSVLKKLTAERFPLIPRVLAGMYRAWHRTCRFSVSGLEHLESAKAGDGLVLFASWHFAFPAVIYYFRDRNGMVMVSRSRDGEWISKVLEWLGYRIARGSPGKRGAAALREMLAFFLSLPPEKGGLAGLGLIADGSQGPAQVAQKGILVLARHTGAPLLPVCMAANPCWRFRSWDRTMLARPFGRIAFAFGPPIRLDRDISAERMEICRRELEDALNRLVDETREAVGLPPEPRL